MNKLMALGYAFMMGNCPYFKTLNIRNVSYPKTPVVFIPLYTDFHDLLKTNKFLGYCTNICREEPCSGGANFSRFSWFF